MRALRHGSADHSTCRARQPQLTRTPHRAGKMLGVMHFRIEQWRAWAPGLESVDDWRTWCAAPVRVADGQQQPDVSFLPAMQRRRLSRLARMLFQVAWPLAEAYPALPLIFASRHGETPRPLAILGDLARGEYQGQGRV